MTSLSPALRSRLRFAGLAAFAFTSAIAIWLANLFLQIGPVPELDGSWQMALNAAWSQDLVFGRDLVWTYGPWGWLTTVYYDAPTFGAHIAWDLAFKGLVAVLLVRLAFTLSWPRRLALIAAALLILPLFADTTPLLLIAGLVVWLARATRPPLPLVAALGVLLGFLSLQKFTFFLMIGGSLGLLAAHLLPPRATARWLTLAGSWFASVLLFWLLAGQDLSAFIPFVQRSAILASGYTEAMFVEEPPLLFRLGLATALAFLVLVWWRPRLDRVALALLVSAFGFLAWKHGFVRADGHTFGFFSCVLFAAILLPRLFDSPPAVVRHGSWALAALALAGAWVSNPGIMGNLGPLLRYHLADNAAKLLHLDAHRAQLEAQTAAARVQTDLPQIRAQVGAATANQFGFEQAFLLLNGLAYQPSPIPQTYQTYSAPLAALNADFYRSPRAPAFTIARLQTIDNRYPTLDDAALLPLLITSHDLVLNEKGFLLLKRQPAAAPLTPRPLTAGRLRYKIETCSLPPDAASSLTWVKLDTPYSALGWLRTFFYKPPLVTLIVTDLEDHESSFRLVAPAARGGFLLSPLLWDTGELQEIISRRTGRPAKSFRVELPPGAEIYFLKRARYEIAALDGFTFRPRGDATP